MTPQERLSLQSRLDALMHLADKERKESIIALLTEEADRIGADPNDDDGKIRQMTGQNFYLWLCVCIELANKRAIAAGYTGAVDQAYKVAVAKLAAKNNSIQRYVNYLRNW